MSLVSCVDGPKQGIPEMVFAVTNINRSCFLDGETIPLNIAKHMQRRRLYGGKATNHLEPKV